MGLLIKLQNGDTSLKSLKFGKDRPGGGDSNQPYVQNPIQIEIKNPSFYNDFILRGGILAPIEAANDVVRLSKYFADIQNPNGILFTAKQNLLSRIGTKTEASKGLGYAGGALNEGVYLPTSTVAQAGVGFTGTHLNKQGIDPTGLFPGLGINKYQDIISQNQLTGRIDLNNNRLVRLFTLISSNKGENNFANVVEYKLNPQLENDVLISYGGGSDSILGIGKTKIKFATSNNNTVLKSILNASSNVSLSGLDKTQTSLFSTWDSQQFSKTSLNLDATTNDDFRLKLNPEAKGLQNTFLSATSGYKDSNNIEVKFGLSSPGSRNRNRSNYYQGSIIQGQTVSEPVDKINAYPIYKSEFKDGSRYSNDPNLKDMIEFSIAILNNDDQNESLKDNEGNVIGTKTNFSYRKYMHFRAFIDNVSDAYTAEWSGINYMGRAEKLYKYKGFDRQMSLGFTVVAQSMNELSVMYDKLNFLASSLAPEYLDSLTSGYMAGNIAYITLGDYINDQPGIITSLTFDIPEDSSWEIERTKNSRRQLPHMIKVKLNFTPIHKFRPSKQTWSNDFSTSGKGISTSVVLADPGNQRYIDPNNTFNAADNQKIPYLKPGLIPLKSNLNQNLITNPDFIPTQTSNILNDFTQNTIFP